MKTLHNHLTGVTLAVALLGIIGLLAAPAARAADTATFDAMASHYEAIWKALAADSLDGVAEHATAIAELAGTAGHPEAAAEAAPEIAQQARSLAAAEDLAAARDAFGDLTKPLVRYRKAVGADRLQVAFCPMAKKAWLQPEGEIENPYYGSAMLSCGSFMGS